MQLKLTGYSEDAVQFSEGYSWDLIWRRELYFDLLMGKIALTSYWVS